MATPPNVGSRQDLPPPGGYPKIRLNRGLGNRGPPGWAIWGGIIGMSIYGLYQLGDLNSEKRYNLQEHREMRMAVHGYLLAERDRRNQISYDKALAREKEIMKNRPDWEYSKQLYHNKKRWLPPTNFFEEDEED